MAASIRAIHKETGKVYYLPPDALSDPNIREQYDIDGTTQVAVTDDRGNKYTVDAADVDRLDNFGAAPMSAEQAAGATVEDWNQQEYGDGFLNTAGSFLENAASGATLGLYDLLVTDPEEKERRRYRDQYNPTAALAGQLTGAVAPALLTGGESLAAKGAIEGAELAAEAGGISRAASAAKSVLASSPAGLASRLGTRITGLGEGAGLLGRTVAAAAGGAAEGSLYGAGQAVSDLALSDKPLSAERVVSALGSAALTGAGYGAALGAAMPVAEEIGGALKKGAGSALKKGEDYIPAKLRKLIPGGKKAAQEEFELALPKVAQHAEDYISSADAIAGEASRLFARVEPLITDYADNGVTAVIESATHDHAHALKGMRKIFGGADELDGTLSTEGIRNLISGSDKEIKKALNTLRTYDESVAKLSNAADLATNTAKRYMDEPTKLVQAAEAIKAGKRLKSEIIRLDRLSASASTRADLGDLAAFLSLAGLDFDNIPIVGDMPLVKYILWGRSVMRLMGKVKGVNKLDSLIGESGNATGVLANKATDIASKTTGLVGSILKTAGKTTAKAADVAGKVAKPATIPATIEVLNSAHFFPQESRQHKAKSVDEAFKRRSDELMQAASQPDVIRASVERNLYPASEDIVDAIAEAQIRKVQFLASKLPKDPTEKRILAKPWKPSNLELKKFSRYMRAAEDPTTALEDLKQGRLSQEAAETLRVVYPSMFANIQTQLLEHVDELRSSLSYKERVQLSRLFGVAVDESMTPEFVAAMQAGYSGDSQDMQSVMNMGAVSQSPVNARNFTPPGSALSTADKLVTSGPGE